MEDVIEEEMVALESDTGKNQRKRGIRVLVSRGMGSGIRDCRL